MATSSNNSKLSLSSTDSYYQQAINVPAFVMFISLSIRSSSRTSKYLKEYVTHLPTQFNQPFRFRSLAKSSHHAINQADRRSVVWEEVKRVAIFNLTLFSSIFSKIHFWIFWPCAKMTVWR